MNRLVVLLIVVIAIMVAYGLATRPPSIEEATRRANLAADNLNAETTKLKETTEALKRANDEAERFRREGR